MRDQRRKRNARFQLEPMEERAVTSAISFNQFRPTVALQRSMAAARTQRTAAPQFSVSNRFGSLAVAGSTAGVGSRATAVPQLTTARPTPVTRPAAVTGNISDVKNGPMAKAGQELINLYLDYQAFVDAGSKGTFRSTHAPGVQVVGTSVRIDVKGTTGAASALAGLGMKIESSNPSTGIIEGLLPIDQLPQAAQLSQVTTIRAVHVPVRR